MTQAERERRDRILAFTWHLIDFIAVLSLIGLLWSWKHLGRTSVETSRETANRRH